MSYELSSIEGVLTPQQISIAYARFNDTKNLKTRKTTKQKTNPQQKAFEIFLDEFKQLFSDEVHRIQTDFNNHKIQDNPEVFSRYLETNYNGLIKLSDTKSAQEPGALDFESKEFKEDPQQFATRQIQYHLQKLFVGPLKKFLESDFKAELIENRLLDTPAVAFLKAMKSNKVSIAHHANLTFNAFNAIYIANSGYLHTVEYNGYHVEALYYQSLDEKYEEFENYVETFVESSSPYHEKVKFLNKLKLKISLLQDLFIKETIPGPQNKTQIEYQRTDASNSLKHKIFHHKIIKNIESFQEALAQLVKVQNTFIIRALKFVTEVIRLLDLEKIPSGYKEPQAEILAAEPSIANIDPLAALGKMQWNGNSNQLIAFFVDILRNVKIHGKPMLEATKQHIIILLTKYFIQKDGTPFNSLSINAIFVPANEDKRPPEHKRIIIPPE